MKKELSLFIIGLFILNTITVVSQENNKENIISDTIYFSEPNLKEKGNYTTVEVSEATRYSMEKDKPMLPVFTKVYTFPFVTKIDDVKVIFSGTIEKKISKPVAISPEPKISYYATYIIKQQDTFETNSEIGIYPKIRYSYRVGAGIKDGQHVIYLSITLNIIQYDSKENIIYYFNRATIDVFYTPPEKPIIFPNKYDLLIISPSNFKSALQPLVDYKNNLTQPIKTKMVTIEEIPVQGKDKQEKIKYYIKNAIESWGITYVLLVGADNEKQKLFPSRYAEIMSFPYESNFPSLLYYADIYDKNGGFSNWDANGNQKYGEYPDDCNNTDLYPDIYLGFLPCNTPIEVSTVVNKIIDYTNHNKMTKKILQVGGDTWADGSENIYEGELLNQKVFEKLPGYTSTCLWGSENTLTKSNIAKGFMSCVDFVDFSGHGDYRSWGTHPPNNETIWLPKETLISPESWFLNDDYDLYFINNGAKLPVVVYNACWNNKYTDDPQCLGWKTISKFDGGGIASFGASSISHTYPGINAPTRLGGWVEIKIFEELYKNKILGNVWSNVITDYIDNFSSDWTEYDSKTVMSLTMFGDPTVVIKDGIDPKIRSDNKPQICGFIIEKLFDYFLKTSEQIRTIKKPLIFFFYFFCLFLSFLFNIL